MLSEENIYKILFDTAAEGLVVANSQGKIIVTNPRLCEMFGYDEAELLGQSIEILVPERLRRKHSGNRANYSKNPKQRSMGVGLDLMGQKKCGNEFPVEISLNSFKLKGKQHVIGLVSDVSERKKVENKVKKIEDSLKNLHKITSNQLLDYKSKIKKLLELGCSIFNMPIGIVARIEEDNYCIDFLHKEVETSLDRDQLHLDHTFCYFAIKQEEPLYIEHVKESEWHKHPCYVHHNINSYLGIKVYVDNKIFGTLNFSSPDRREADIMGADIEILKLMAEWLGQEIQKYKNAEKLINLNIELETRVEERTKKLKDSEKLYSTIARNFPKGTINVFDKNLNYVFVEGKELFQLGITSKLLIGTNYLDRLQPEIAEMVEPMLRKVFEGESQEFEIEHKGNYYSINAVPLLKEAGTVTQIMVVEKNITDEKIAEQETLRALEQEKALNELKSRFVSMASHEFRTPLSTILSSSSLVQKYLEKGMLEKTAKHLNRIKSSVGNLTSILNDFLSLDKLEEGKISINFEEFDIYNFAEELTEEMQSVTKKNQHIKYSHNGDNIIKSDRNILKNVLHNLLSNAIKYSPEGKDITFNTNKQGNSLIIKISDKGIGIPKNEQKHLFERFFRAKNVINIQGTGLGLNIVAKYLEKLNGNISFESEENKGTIFTLILPQ